MYDLAIIGTGPAGYTAAIYASRYNLKTLLIGQTLGGMANLAHKIENWPGEQSINGADLMKKMLNHVKAFEIPIKQELVAKLENKNTYFEIQTSKEKYQAKTLVLALGTEHRKLSIPGEDEYRGKGVSYCATCDGAFFKNKNVAVIGGGDSAFMAGLQLSEIAKQVYMIFVEDKPKAMPSKIEKIKQKNNITLIPHNSISKISGNNIVQEIELKEPYNSQKEIKVDGVFIEIGQIPNTKLIEDLKIKISDKNYIEVTPAKETNVPGIFAAGDITTGSGGFAQIVTSASEGAIAAFSAFKFLKSKK